MTERLQDPRRLDVRGLATDAASLQGTEAGDAFERFAQSVGAPIAPARAAPVQWSAHGERRPAAVGEPEIWLRLQAQTDVTLTCQRCLQPMLETLLIDRHYQFVTNVDEAERLDEISDDEVLVLARQLDLFNLLEDELILALPIVPRHELCPHPLVAGGSLGDDAELDDVPHAFAALAALRKPPLAN